MSRSICTLILSAACALAACAPAAPEPAPEPAPPEPSEPSAPSAPSAPELGAAAEEEAAVERLIEPTAAQLRAARAGDPALMAEAVAASGGCQAPSTCPAQFASCTAWSAPAQCSFECGPRTCFCPDYPDGSTGNCNPDDLVGTTRFNSYRVCFDSAQNACTEWKLQLSSYCGC